MTRVMRVLVFGVAAFNLVVGMTFLLAPMRIAPAFSIVPSGVQGIATLRADFPAFFLCGAGFAMVGAWRQACAPLRVPLVLLGTALFGRVISVVVDGVVTTTIQPMLVEFVMIVILALAHRQFAHADR